jgi:hypothetical protein
MKARVMPSARMRLLLLPQIRIATIAKRVVAGTQFIRILLDVLGQSEFGPP